jgi:anti-sigma B factor antagonist
MDVMIDDRNGVTVVRPLGDRIDAQVSPMLAERLGGVFAAGAHRLLIDLGRVEFMDSSGIGVLVGLYKRVQHGGGVLGLACPQPNVLATLRLARVDGVLGVHASLDEGVEKLRG